MILNDLGKIRLLGQFAFPRARSRVFRSALGISRDGRVVVGEFGGEAFVWDAFQGARCLKSLSDTTAVARIANAASADGSTLLGLGVRQGDSSLPTEVFHDRLGEPATSFELCPLEEPGCIEFEVVARTRRLTNSAVNVSSPHLYWLFYEPTLNEAGEDTRAVPWVWELGPQSPDLGQKLTS